LTENLLKRGLTGKNSNLKYPSSLGDGIFLDLAKSFLRKNLLETLTPFGEHEDDPSYKKSIEKFLRRE
jgi:hypothetical protein